MGEDYLATFFDEKGREVPIPEIPRRGHLGRLANPPLPTKGVKKEVLREQLTEDIGRMVAKDMKKTLYVVEQGDKWCRL